MGGCCNPGARPCRYIKPFNLISFTWAHCWRPPRSLYSISSLVCQLLPRIWLPFWAARAQWRLKSRLPSTLIHKPSELQAFSAENFQCSFSSESSICMWIQFWHMLSMAPLAGNKKSSKHSPPSICSYSNREGFFPPFFFFNLFFWEPSEQKLNFIIDLNLLSSFC